MVSRRILRLNTLLAEVISETVHREVKHPGLHHFVSIRRVEVSPDLHQAKVYVSLLATPEEKERVVAILQEAAGFIAVRSSKKVRLRYFPSLRFFVDESVDQLMHIEGLLEQARSKDQAAGREASDQEPSPAAGEPVSPATD